MKAVNNKTMSTILPFIRILHLKQQSNTFRCFWSLKFKKGLCNNKLSSSIFLSKKIAHTAGKVFDKN